jgi:hypothetical protein
VGDYGVIGFYSYIYPPVKLARLLVFFFFPTPVLLGASELPSASTNDHPIGYHRRTILTQP